MANEANDALGWDLGAEGSVPGPWGNRMGDLIEDHNKRLAVLIDPQTALSAVKADNGKCQAFDTRAIWEGVAQCGYILTKDKTISPEQYQQLLGQARDLGVTGNITPTKQFA